eukprot:TRINITY_DN6072_c0_g1_i1.p1 TRINITY_DN6072_c0_g1~~TRINITY_DN6072_c0_g1_i1.p1  ORF type:complete len:512 (-),score=57.65 TRINITY_DN6072_c0_g1_i1:136-1671(-)
MRVRGNRAWGRMPLWWVVVVVVLVLVDVGVVIDRARGACILDPQTRRGMYASIYTTNLGDDTLPVILSNVLASTDKLDQFFRFIQATGVNVLTLYDTNTILADPDLTLRLRSFISTARRIGIAHVETPGGTAQSFYSKLWTYQSASAPEERFDGIVTEIEFWQPSNGISVSAVVDTIHYVKSLDFPLAVGSTAFTCGVYIGWATQTDIAAIAGAGANLLLIHAYVTNPNNAWTYAQQRMNYAYSTSPSDNHVMKTAIIFSAEGQAHSAGDEHFMGDWLAANTNASASTTDSDWSGIVKAEAIVSADQSAAESSATLNERFAGYQWYEYGFAYQYMTAGWPGGSLPALYGGATALGESFDAVAATYVGNPVQSGAEGDPLLRGYIGYPIDLSHLLWRAVSQSTLYPDAQLGDLSFHSNATTVPANFERIDCSNAKAGDIMAVGSVAAVVADSNGNVYGVSSNQQQAVVAIVPGSSLGIVTHSSSCFSFKSVNTDTSASARLVSPLKQAFFQG